MTALNAALTEHRTFAEQTHYHVDDLEAVRELLLEALDATVDADVDQAAAKLGVLLSVLPREHMLVIAAQAGLALGESRREHRAEMVEVSHAVSEARLQQDEDQRRRRRPVKPIRPAIQYPPVPQEEVA